MCCLYLYFCVSNKSSLPLFTSVVIPSEQRNQQALQIKMEEELNVKSIGETKRLFLGLKETGISLKGRHFSREAKTRARKTVSALYYIRKKLWASGLWWEGTTTTTAIELHRRSRSNGRCESLVGWKDRQARRKKLTFICAARCLLSYFLLKF